MKFTCPKCKSSQTLADDYGKTHGTHEFQCPSCLKVSPLDAISTTGIVDITAWEEAQWYVVVKDKQEGPKRAQDIIKQCKAGTLSDQTLAWREGMDSWLPLDEIDEFAALRPPPSPFTEPVRRPARARAAGPSTPDKPIDENYVQSAPGEATRVFMLTAGIYKRKRNARIAGIAAAVLVGIAALVLLADMTGIIKVRIPGAPPPAVAIAPVAVAPVPQPVAAPTPPAEREAIREELAPRADAVLGDVKIKNLPRALTEGAITQVISQNAASINPCLGAAGAKNKHIEGKMDVMLVVAPSGEVKNAQVLAGPFKSSALGDCAMTQVRGWKFPRFSGRPLTINFPYMFSNEP